LIERIRAAAEVARRHNPALRFEERKPGVKTRILPECAHRGAVKDCRETPCCGGKVRREELFACAHVQNEVGEAWSIMCQGCRINGSR
jgi:hypothetical protein